MVPSMLNARHANTTMIALASLLLLPTLACNTSDGPCDLGPGDRFSAKVIEVVVGGDNNTHRSPQGAEGAANCETDPDSFVSLGGGHIVFDIGCHYQTEPGPEMIVFEAAGACHGISEEYNVSVSSNNMDYTPIGKGFGDTSFDVVQVQEFRYVRIQDDLSNSSSDSPGADIDALALLHAK
ncbi:MAG: hypothetical protein KAI47_04665 [Deltaproteobacteria bacterium]|nr:hypothetical protein [Deltaproteobacteria bacterium]